jgi:AAA family ATPase
MRSARYVSDQHLLGPTAMLFHGPEGTGKSLLLERLAECPWKEVYRINTGTHPKGQAKALTETFEDAHDNQPSLILMDNLDRFLEKADTLVERLRIELAKLEGSEVVVAAAARSIYNVDSSLRTRSTFKIGLEIFPPDVRQREDIFRQILGPGRKLDHTDIPSLAARTHGFVGRDIDHLCGLARARRVDRADESLEDDQKETLTEILEKTDYVTHEDFEAVIDQVQPTVLKESILEVPKVRWTDIAGVDHVRALLEAITIRPFKVSTSYPTHTNARMSTYQHMTYHPTAPRPRPQIRRPPIPQRRPPLRPPGLRQNPHRTSRRHRIKPKLPRRQGLRAHQDVRRRI